MKKAPQKDKKKYIRPSDSDIYMSLLWLKDEIALSKEMKHFGKRNWGSSMYSRIARGIRQAYRDGKLKLNN